MSDGLMFYRCAMCKGVVSAWDISAFAENHDKGRDKGACPKCGGSRLRPTNLGLWEKLVQVAKHPLIWKWPECTASGDPNAA